MGTGNPKVSPPPALFPQLAQVEAAISGLVDRLDTARLPLRDLDVGTRSIARLERTRARLLAEVAAVPLSPVQTTALALLACGGSVPRKKLEEAAKNGDKIGKHAGQSARWTGYLRAVDAIRAGRLTDPMIRVAIGGHRAPASIRSFLRAAGVEVGNG